MDFWMLTVEKCIANANEVKNTVPVNSFATVSSTLGALVAAALATQAPSVWKACLGRAPLCSRATWARRFGW